MHMVCSTTTLKCLDTPRKKSLFSLNPLIYFRHHRFIALQMIFNFGNNNNRRESDLLSQSDCWNMLNRIVIAAMQM
jgi:hypothetical protein